MDHSTTSIAVADLLTQLPEGLVQISPGTAGRSVQSVVIADPDAPEQPLPADSFVLGIGARGVVASRLIGAAGKSGAVAVAIRGGAATRPIVSVAETSGITLFELASGHRWNDLYGDLLAVVNPPPALQANEELVALAQTIATLTNGMVTIEDMNAHVLAYSTSTDDADELRRLSILGRSGPPAYLALLRKWGVYDRLSRPDKVVEIEADPSSGVRRRLAIGIFAGSRQLGVIWVQQGASELPPNAGDTLRGAARVAASELATGQPSARRRRESDELASLLSGASATLRSWPPQATARPCAVAAFSIAHGRLSKAERLLQVDALAATVRVHAAALRADALVTSLDGGLYLLVPDLPRARLATPMLRAACSAAQRYLGCRVRAALGPVVHGLAAAPQSRRCADVALRVPRRGDVVLFDELQSLLLVEAVVSTITEHPELQDSALTTLVTRDPELARTLLCYLDSGSDAISVAKKLQVHPTTVRYRMRKVAQEWCLELADPDTRLATHLRLRALIPQHR